MHYISKPRYGFLLFTNHLVLLFSILLFCSSCFESIKDKGKKVEEYKESIDLEELESIPKKDVSSKNKDDDFSNCKNENKDRKTPKKDSKTSVKESVRLQTSKEPSGPSIEEERKRREKERESLRQKRIIEITLLLEQSMQSLGSRLQSAHESRLNREAEIARNQQEEEQSRLRREEERVRIEQDLEEARVRLEEERIRLEQEDQADAIREEERIEQEAILESIRTESARVRREQDAHESRIRRLPIRSPIENEENNADITEAMEASRITASLHARSLRPLVMSKREAIEKLKSKLTLVSGSHNEECPICVSDFTRNPEDCYQLSTCCNKVLHINCIANSAISSYTAMGIYRCPLCRATLL